MEDSNMPDMRDRVTSMPLRGTAARADMDEVARKSGARRDAANLIVRARERAGLSTEWSNFDADTHQVIIELLLKIQEQKA